MRERLVTVLQYHVLRLAGYKDIGRFVSGGGGLVGAVWG